MNDAKSKIVKTSQTGGVIIEFALLVPILLFVCFSLVDIGQAFSQKAWLESVAYQSVMTGGELQTARVSSMQNMGDGLRNMLHIQLDKKMVNPLATTASEDTANGRVTATIPGEVRVLTNLFKLPYSISLTGPLLTRTSTVNEADPSPQNDLLSDGVTLVPYDCFGNKITAARDYGLSTCSATDTRSVCTCSCTATGRGSHTAGCY